MKRSNHFFTILYTTHSHLPEAPRARLLIPLTRDVTPEEYNAIVRYVAAEISMEMIDICSFKINQPMFWPNCSLDGQYIFRRYEGDWLDPDRYLADHPSLHDYSSLPTAPAEKEDVSRQRKMQEDPLKKGGIVGAFCRAYTPQNVIAKYLSHVYAPSVKEGHYDYIPGEGPAGVVIYDGRFAYSHHATDPAGGRLLNAFDLARLHLFPEDDEKTSFLKMCDLAEKDELVKETLEAERFAEARKDFEETMANAIRLGRYYLSHALAVYDVIPKAAMHRDANRILQIIRERHMTEFERRIAMRYCRAFKTVVEIQPVLDFLDDYGYIIRQPDKTFTGGRPPFPKYTVNPTVLS